MSANTQSMKHARDAFQRASGFARAGDLSMAESACRRALEQFPGENNLSCLLGAVLIRAHRAVEAEALLRAVVARVPDFAKAHDELANALLAQDRPEQALPSLERTIELEPGNALAGHKLREVRAALNAEEHTANDGLPDLASFDAALLKAAQFSAARQFREAEKIYQALLAADPDNALLYQRLGSLAVEQKQFGDAVILFKRAVAHEPENVSAWLDLGRANAKKNAFDAAETAFACAIELEPKASLPHQLLAGLHTQRGQHDKAIPEFETAIDLQGDNFAALLGLGHSLRVIGRQEDAIAAYRRLIAARPHLGEAYWSLANLKTAAFSVGELESMRQQLESSELPDDERVFFCFALGKADEDRGDFDSAFEYFETGNTIRRRQEVYDPVETQSIIDRLMTTFDKDVLIAGPTSERQGPVPIFIVGMPRSGSTLVEQILASHSRVAGTRELASLEQVVRHMELQRSDATYPELVSQLDDEILLGLGDQYLAATQPYRDDSPYFTDKLPHNFRHIGLIHLILPEAKIVDVRRHPMDSCMGSYKQLFATGQPFSYDLFELGEYYLEYRRLMQHWQDVMPNKILTVRYEHLVYDLDGQVRRLLDYCGLPMESACLRFFETKRAIESASSEQVRQPIYATAVNHWRNYEKHLADLFETLKPALD